MPCRLSRLIKLIRIVRGRSFPSVQDLCDAFQIKERTLFSDLRELKEELGVDIKFDRTRRGYYLASEQSDINFVTLTQESAVILSAAFGLLSCYGGEHLSMILQNQFATEIEFCLPGHLAERRVLKYADHSNGNVHGQIIRADVSRDQVDKDVFVRLCLACLKHETLKISVVRAAVPSALLNELPASVASANEIASFMAPVNKPFSSMAPANGPPSSMAGRNEPPPSMALLNDPRSLTKGNQRQTTELIVRPQHLLFKNERWRLVFEDSASPSANREMALSEILDIPDS